MVWGFFLSFFCCVSASPPWCFGFVLSVFHFRLRRFCVPTLTYAATKRYRQQLIPPSCSYPLSDTSPPLLTVVLIYHSSCLIDFSTSFFCATLTPPKARDTLRYRASFSCAIQLVILKQLLLVLSEGPSSPSSFLSGFCKVRGVRGGGEGVRSARRRESRG